MTRCAFTHRGAGPQCCIETETGEHDGMHHFKCAGEVCPGLIWPASVMNHPITCFMGHEGVPHDDTAETFTALRIVIHELYAASAACDRSRIAFALDLMTDRIDHWRRSSPTTIAELFRRLDPEQCVRVVGQTLLAVTRVTNDSPVARRAFMERFLAVLCERGEPTLRFEEL